MTKRIRTDIESARALSVAALVAQVLILQACGGNPPSVTGSGGSGSGTGGTTATGTGGSTGAGGATTGTGGSTGAGGATTGTGGSTGGDMFLPSCSGLTTAAAVEPTKGGACVPADPQLCYKTCGPEKAGAKSETCTGGVYAEMSGCSFNPNKNYSCYKVPAAANAACPAGVTPQASMDCTVDMCVLCNTMGGLPNGHYNDSGGADKIGYCVCQAPNSAGKRSWSCASDTAWPCPAGAGC